MKIGLTTNDAPKRLAAILPLHLENDAVIPIPLIVKTGALARDVLSGIKTPRDPPRSSLNRMFFFAMMTRLSIKYISTEVPIEYEGIELEVMSAATSEGYLHAI